MDGWSLENMTLQATEGAKSVENLRARVSELEVGLSRLAEEYEAALAYVPDYFRDKWEMDDELAAARELLGPGRRAEVESQP